MDYVVCKECDIMNNYMWKCSECNEHYCDDCGCWRGRGLILFCKYCNPYFNVVPQK